MQARTLDRLKALQAALAHKAPVHVFVCSAGEGRRSRGDQLAAFRLENSIGLGDPMHEVIITFSDGRPGAEQ